MDRDKLELDPTASDADLQESPAPDMGEATQTAEDSINLIETAAETAGFDVSETANVTQAVEGSVAENVESGQADKSQKKYGLHKDGSEEAALKKELAMLISVQ